MRPKKTKYYNEEINSPEKWNNAHPVGTRVRYWPVLPPHPGIEPFETVTRSHAWWWNAGGGILVSVEGRSGGLLINHLEVLK